MQNRTIFGQLNDGRDVGSYALTNDCGLEMTVLEYGCIIQSLKIPTKLGLLDVVLGFDDIEYYVESRTLPAPPHFGAVIGRYSGRIKNGQFSIDGNHYQLDANNGPNTLHGGLVGFDKILWHVKDVTKNSITLQHLSTDGEEHFPGNLEVNVRYTLTLDNEIVIEYWATAGNPTIINMTQHTYFNLDGHNGNILDQELMVNSHTLLETDNEIIPTGQFIEAADLDYDFTQPRNCPKNIDASFVIDDTTKPAAVLISSSSGLRLTVSSDQPSVHLYVGGDLFGRLKGKESFEYHPHSGICFESQKYPDAPNNAHFPNAVLKAGETYRQKTVWKFDNI